jgi:tetratricopeptide (TPR) repeat protein
LLRYYDDALLYLNKSIEIGELLLRKESALYAIEIASTLALSYNNRGVAYEYNKKYEKSLLDKNKSIEMYERLRIETIWDDENENNLAKAYMNRSVTYGSLQLHSEEYSDLEKCIAMWMQMKREGRSVNENDLARALMNKGIFEASHYAEKNKASLDKTMQGELVRSIMAARKNKK